MKKMILSFLISLSLASNTELYGSAFSPENKLKQLEIETQHKVRQLLKLAEKEIPDYKIIVAETWRSMARQKKLYHKGSSMSLAQAGRSWHNWGRAVDIYFVKGKRILPYEKAPYKKLGELAEGLGFIWGGRWKIPFDPGHFEYHPNLTIAKMLKDKEAQVKWLR